MIGRYGYGTPQYAKYLIDIETKEEKMAQKKGLGKGLSALMNEDYSAAVSTEAPVKPSLAKKEEAKTEAASAQKNDATNTADSAATGAGQVLSVPVEGLHPGMFQPRRHFERAALEELAESIRSNGVMQPIVVRQSQEKSGAYEIIAGERRWRASQLAELNYVPVIVQDLADKQVLEQALIENIQRQDLTAMEEAEGYQRLMKEFSHTQEQLAKSVGKSRSHVANLLRMLQLPDAVKSMVNSGVLSMGHGRALLALESDEQMSEAAQAVEKKGLNVRQTEALCKKMLRGENDNVAPKAPRAPSVSGGVKDSEILELEGHLSDIMGMRVTIDDKGNKGTIHLHYESLAQLDDILQRLSDSAI